MTNRRSSRAKNRGARRSYRGRRRGKPVFPFKLEELDYKNVELLQRFISDRGKIKARRKTGASGKVQRRLAREIKRARHLAFLPYTAEHIRDQQ